MKSQSNYSKGQKWLMYEMSYTFHTYTVIPLNSINMSLGYYLI